jgi:LmbE family N-acetylglucosaminyl deacetylase
MTSLTLKQPNAEIFVPDGANVPFALSRTSHIGIGAHQDDLEILAAHGILECFARPDRWFCGVVVTDGAGSPRDLEYKRYTDEQMREVRRMEQKKAAFIGEYSTQIFLDYPSAVAKDATETRVVGDLAAVLSATRPEVVYTHNLADKHDTHVAVALRVITACRQLPDEHKPQRLIGCEVWRDLDWLRDADKVALPVSGREHLQAALLGVFDSQIAGGKRYDLATAGRRRAHATYSESHGTDEQTGLIWGMDLTPLIRDASLDPEAFVVDLVRKFETDVRSRVAKLRG